MPGKENHCCLLKGGDQSKYLGSGAAFSWGVCDHSDQDLKAASLWGFIAWWQSQMWAARSSTSDNLGPDPACNWELQPGAALTAAPWPLGMDTLSSAWGGLGGSNGHRAPASGALTLHPELKLSTPASVVLGESLWETWTGGI